MDTFQCGGPGGQHQNKTDSGVRITHITTGLVSECREHRSQHQNKKTAFHRLAHLILQWHREEQAKLNPHKRNPSVIRTYHAVENRVKNHDTGFTQTWDEVISDISDMMNDRIRSVQDQPTP